MIFPFLLWGTVFLICFAIFRLRSKLKSHEAHFKSQGVPYIGVGLWRLLQTIFGFSNPLSNEVKVYQIAKSYPDKPIVGFTDMSGAQGICTTDPDLIRNILVKDFDHFVNRRSVSTQGSNVYFSKMLIFLESDHWKGVRAKLSPSFTTGKIRRMFSIFAQKSEAMVNYILNETSRSGGEFNLGAAFPKYTMDVIASCALGVDSKCFETPAGAISLFEDLGSRLQPFRFSLSFLLKFIVMSTVPKVSDWFGLEVMDPEPQKYFSGVIKRNMKHRRETGERHEDFLQLMMDAQKGLLKSDEDSKEVMYGNKEAVTASDEGMARAEKTIQFDDDHIIANCMVFMLAGFDTVESLLSFTAYNLALEPEVQGKLREEIREKMEEHGGKLTYEAVAEMGYLDMVLNETLRVYSPAVRTERVCNKNYPVPGTNYVLPKGAVVIVPIYPIHHDEKYYEKPEKFDPERWTPERKAKLHPYAYMPFGHGPRNCIGMRFALIEAKAAIAQLVYNFKLEPCSQTFIPMKFGNDLNLKPKDGQMWLKVTPIAQT